MATRDDRTEAEKRTHTWLIVGTDTFLSGWGKASEGKSYAVWACRPEDRARVLSWVEGRSDMTRVREVSEYEEKYRPRGCADCHVYVVGKSHPSLN
jgi:formate-dependent nitrite reductase cytochrome c552 subunit